MLLESLDQTATTISRVYKIIKNRKKGELQGILGEAAWISGDLRLESRVQV